MNFKKLVISAFAMAAAIVGCKPEEGTALSVEPVLTETMEIDPATGAIIVGNEKQSFTIKVTADCQWAVRCDAEWLDLSAKTGNGNAEIVAYVLDNDASERQVALLFQKHDTKKVRHYVSVLQKGSVEAPSEGEGTLEKPYLASQAAAIAGALASGETTATAVYVKGYVKKFASKHEDGINSFGNALFYITDTPDGTGTDFYCYQVYYLGGQKFTSLDQIKVGDEYTASSPTTTAQLRQRAKVQLISTQSTDRLQVRLRALVLIRDRVTILPVTVRSIAHILHQRQLLLPAPLQAEPLPTRKCMYMAS